MMLQFHFRTQKYIAAILVMGALLFIAQTTQAQQLSDAELVVQAGDQYFENGQYFRAKKYYEEAIKNDPELLIGYYKLADCYRLLFEYNQSIPFYEKVVEKNPKNLPLAGYYLAMMYKFSGQFDLAIEKFDQFLEITSAINPEDWAEKDVWIDQAFVEKEGAIFALQQSYRNISKDKVRPLSFPVNSEFNDYAATIYLSDSNLVITSGRFGTQGQIIDHRYGEALTDNFRFLKGKKSWKLEKINDKFDVTNSRWNDGAGVFNARKDHYYFTRCGNSENNNCQIWLSRQINGIWSEPVPINAINIADYDTKHPAISLNEDTLYFVSDRPGGFGKNDLWMSVKVDQENWTDPVNLGKSINTPLDEISPFYHFSTSRLFFSSNGHQSMGGLDVYMIDYNSQIEDPQIINLGVPVNSEADDCYFSLGKQLGYISSNRGIQDGKFDIFQFEIEDFSQFINSDLFLSGRDWVINTKLNIGSYGDLVSLRQEDALFYENIDAQQKIEFDMIFAVLMEQNQQVSKEELADLPEHYREQVERIQSRKFNTLSTTQQEKHQTYIGKVSVMPTRENEFLIISGKLIDVSSKDPLANVKIEIYNAQGYVVKSTYTNEDGSFEFTDVKGLGPFRINYKPENGNLLAGVSLAISGLNVQTIDKNAITINFSPIYFAHDQFSIASHAKPILDEMAKYLQRDPKLKIEFHAYTDSTGTESYNRRLSRKRGESILEYLREKGVKENALVVKALGENYDIAVEDTVLLNQQRNRKVEFSINSGRIPFASSFKTVVTLEDMTVEELSNHIDIDIETLTQLNEFTAEQMIKAYEPVTIFAANEFNSKFIRSINSPLPLQ